MAVIFMGELKIEKLQFANLNSVPFEAHLDSNITAIATPHLCGSAGEPSKPHV
jgi:hypothetical protein